MADLRSGQKYASALAHITLSTGSRPGEVYYETYQLQLAIMILCCGISAHYAGGYHFLSPDGRGGGDRRAGLDTEGEEEARHRGKE